MAQTKVRKKFEAEVREVLHEGLALHGIDATVESEPAVRGTKWCFWVISRDFKDYNQAARQDIVWRILDKSFDLTHLVKITMVFTLTPKEARGEF